MKTRLVLLLIVLPAISVTSVSACTTFVLKNQDQIIYGRSFDFDIGNGFIVNNKRGIQKRAFVQDINNAMKWTSKYGSITFNQAGMEFPYGGMNESGLVIAQMYYGQSQYPSKDHRKEISVLQWIQYQLDIAGSVDEVIASDTILRISNEMPVGIHVLVCDSNGKIASIAFIDGEMVCWKDEELPIPLMNNNSYEESISYLKQFDIMGGNEEITWNNANDITSWSHDNTLAGKQLFAAAAQKMSNVSDESNLVESGFDVLKSVTLGSHTKWSTIFDVTNSMIYFKNQKRKEIITLNMSDFDFNKDAQSIILDIQSATSENTMSQFVPYTTELNRKYTYDAVIPLIESGFIPFQLSEEMIEAQIMLPEQFKKIDR
ncbi:MAG: linear amide C-N hydrolase [Bacteroidota bacterium]